jgi:hypothetical protein
MVNRLLVWAGGNSRLEGIANTNSLAGKMVHRYVGFRDTVASIPRSAMISTAWRYCLVASLAPLRSVTASPSRSRIPRIPWPFN